MSASLHPMWRPYLLNNKRPKLDYFNTLRCVPNNLQEAYAFILWDIEYHASKDGIIYLSTTLAILYSNTPGSTQKTRILKNALRAYTTAIFYRPCFIIKQRLTALQRIETFYHRQCTGTGNKWVHAYNCWNVFSWHNPTFVVRIAWIRK